MKTLTILSILVTCQLGNSAAVPNWPQFRGPNSSGVAESDQVPVDFGPGSNLLWKVAVPGGVSSPCVWGDHLFLTASEQTNLTTLAINRQDGKILWRQSLVVAAPRELHKKNHVASATPATDGRTVCVFYPTFGLLAYDFEGRELWRKPMTGLMIRNGSGTSPAMLNGRLVLNCDVEENKSFLVAFDPASGRESWRIPRTDFVSSYATPILWSHDGRDDVVISGSLRVVGYDLRDGKEQWSIAGTEAVSVCPTPVIGANQLYVMSRSFGGTKLPPFALFALTSDKNADLKITREEAPRALVEQGVFAGIDRDQDGSITEAEWEQTVAYLNKADYGIFALKNPGAGELSTNHVAWKHKKGVASVSSPLFYRGRVYVAQDGGRVTCMKAAGGEKLYEQERLGAEGDYYASPIAANGHVYFSSSQGIITVAEDGETLQVKSRNNLGEPIYATPAIVEHKLYVRTAEHLWAFGR